MVNTPAFGATILHRKECVNSMNWGKVALLENPHGTLLCADNHRLVRGRQGRSWHAMPGQLLLTYLVKPAATQNITTPDSHGGSPLIYLYYALNLGLCEAIKQFCPNARIKWPNDCLLGSLKVAGMLLEPVWQADKLQGLVLGIGLNVNNRFAKDSELLDVATSMRTYKLHGPHDETEVLAAINAQLTNWFDRWQSGDFQAIWDSWQELHLDIGTAITAHCADGTQVTGTIHEISIDGNLVIKTDAGNRQFSIGDVVQLANQDVP